MDLIVAPEVLVWKTGKKYTQEYFEKLGISSGDTIFDVGCGSGAFVYPLYLQKHRVGGWTTL